MSRRTGAGHTLNPDSYYPLDAAALARFEAKYSIEESGCWVWAGSRNEDGYGTFWLAGGARVAHRVSYFHHVSTLPPEVLLDHLCRVRSCVNPAHLEPVTNAENIRRGNTGLPQRSRTHCPRGHEYTTANTYRYKDGRRNCRTCMRVLGAESQKRRTQKARAEASMLRKQIRAAAPVVESEATL